MPEKERTLAESMVAIFGELENPKFDKSNPHFGNKYASLPSIKSVVRPVCSKHGVRYAQDVRLVSDANGCPVFDSAGNPIRALFTEFSNSQGEKELYSWPFIPEKGGPQAAGSAGTYSERQGLCATLGIAGEEDDDGEAAETDRPSSPEKPVAAPPLVAKKGANLAEDKGTTLDEYRARITNMLKDMSGNDAGKMEDMLASYTAFQGNDGKVQSRRTVDKLSIGWARSTCHTIEKEYQKWIEDQIDGKGDNEVIKFIEEGGMP